MATTILPALEKSLGSCYVRETAPGLEWAVGNGLTERRVRFDQEGLHTPYWAFGADGQNLIRSRDYAERRAFEFGFQADRRRFDGGSRMRLAGAEGREAGRGGLELCLRFALEEAPLEVEVVYAVYPEFAAIRKRLRVTNLGGEAVTLSRMCFEAVNLEVGPPEHLQLFGQYGLENRELYYTGRVNDPCVRLENARTGLSCAILNEAPGHLKRSVVMAWSPFWGARVQAMYDTDLFPFERRLEPGERFESAAASVLLYRGGSQEAIPRYADDILSRSGPGFVAPVQYNTWPGFAWRIDERTVLEQVPLAARMGAELFCVDEGWGEYIGDNRVSHRFPNGLEPIQRAVEAHGMRLGLWVSLAAMDGRSAAHQAQPEWAARERDGRPKTTGTAEGEVVVMCLATPYRDAAAERILELIRRYRLAYLKLDLTTIFNAYGEAPGCHAGGHDHGSWAESLALIYEGIAQVCGRVSAEFPEVLLDLTFELWGQKHLVDYGLLRLGDLDWMSNVGDLEPDSGAPRQARTLLYARAGAIPAERMLIGNLQAETGDWLERIASTLGSAPLLSGDLRKVSSETLDRYGRIFYWFKQLRSEVRLERFVPLGCHQAPTPKAWDGFARLSREGEGLVAAFRNKAPEPGFGLRLELPEGRYRLRSVPGDYTVELSAEELRRGIGLEFAQGARAELLEVRRAR